MVKPFQFARLPLICFGRNKRSELPDLIKQYGTRIILVSRGVSFTESDQGKDLLENLERNGIVFDHVFVTTEPSPKIVDDAVLNLSDFDPDAVVAIGGGSVIDAGKAISAMITVKGNVIDYLEGVGTSEHPGTKIPFIAVPTTSGTGSEATKNAVISHTGKNGFKKSLRHDNFVPDIAIIDPELTVSCPAELTAASGMDCFTQLVEAFLSDKSNNYTDALAIEGLRAVRSSLLRCYTDGSDLEARTGMSFAALTSGICLANAGLGAVHGFASSIGGRYNIPHGIICGTLMSAANELNVKILRKGFGNKNALGKYALLGELFLENRGKDDDANIDGFIEYLHVLTEKLNLPGLKGYGINKNDLEEICQITDVKNNPVKLETSDLMEILMERFV
jgi:alcohol dehydrogenase class IV